MIIETRDAADSRAIAQKLLAAADNPADVRTVFRGGRLAYEVPDELGKAIGRTPDAEQDAAEQEQPAEGAEQDAEQQPAEQPAVEPDAADEQPKRRGKAH